MESKLPYTEGRQDAQIKELMNITSDLKDDIQDLSNATATLRRDIKADMMDIFSPCHKAVYGNGDGGGLVAKVAWHGKVIAWGMSVLAAFTASAFIRGFFVGG